jgi:hypothetical protein
VLTGIAAHRAVMSADRRFRNAFFSTRAHFAMTGKSLIDRN